MDSRGTGDSPRAATVQHSAERARPPTPEAAPRNRRRNAKPNLRIDVPAPTAAHARAARARPAAARRLPCRPSSSAEARDPRRPTLHLTSTASRRAPAAAAAASSNFAQPIHPKQRTREQDANVAARRRAERASSAPPRPLCGLAPSPPGHYPLPDSLPPRAPHHQAARHASRRPAPRSGADAPERLPQPLSLRVAHARAMQSPEPPSEGVQPGRCGHGHSAAATVSTLTAGGTAGGASDVASGVFAAAPVWICASHWHCKHPDAVSEASFIKFNGPYTSSEVRSPTEGRADGPPRGKPM
eukprot:364284-Chlamydomonas_euryale.AAC.6